MKSKLFLPDENKFIVGTLYFVFHLNEMINDNSILSAVKFPFLSSAVL